MTAMRVIHTGPEHRPQVEPVFEERGVVDVTIREGGTETTPESRGPRPRTASAPDPVRTLRS
ncbi:hypothetical protein [Mycobacterium sp.]|uniref:hypothetical protein n=1 Tax=Mycobacterium sp. TaxID=1785 RepID=UPI003F9CFBE6